MIGKLAKAVPPPTSTFLPTSKTNPIDIISHYKRVYTRTIQLVDAHMDISYPFIRETPPYIKLVQIVHVVDENAVREAIDMVLPFGIDLCSGVWTEGRLDEVKLSAFFEVVNG